MEILIAGICTFVIIWCVMYAIVMPQVYYKCVYNDDVTVFVDSKTIFSVHVIYNTGEHAKIPLFFFTHNFEMI